MWHFPWSTKVNHLPRVRIRIRIRIAVSSSASNAVGLFKEMLYFLNCLCALQAVESHVRTSCW